MGLIKDEQEIIGGSVGTVKGPTDIVEAIALRITKVGEVPSSLANTRRSSLWSEDIESGADGGHIGYVGPYDLYSGFEEADLAYPLDRPIPLARPWPVALPWALPQP